MQTIVPCLWFDTQAEEAIDLYTSVFDRARIGRTSRYDAASAKASGQPEGSVLTIEFEIEGYAFTALNGGPAFRLNPSISFFVECAEQTDVDALWAALSEGGAPLMPLDSYPFSARYGWLQDRYGVSWQLMYAPAGGRRRITPSLMFVGENAGRAEEAVRFWVSVFDDAKVGTLSPYGPGQDPNAEDMLAFADFELHGQRFAAMDSAHAHDFAFNEAVSMQVMCDTQEQIDAYWHALSAVPEAERCGWLKDRYGVSWQIVPKALPQLLRDPDKAKAQRVMEAMLQMEKLDIGRLRAAYDA